MQANDQVELQHSPMATERSHPKLIQTHKPLGAYLVEAGLLSEAQVGVILADQGTTSLPFGEIVVTRGWIKAQTIEYLMQKIVLPERDAQKSQSYRKRADLEQALTRQRPQVSSSDDAVGRARSDTFPVNAKSTYTPELKMARSSEDGVNWIG
ncbi:MAG TPA: hypothetical protein V6D19_10320 [Stenomitos sp.]